MRNVCGRYAVRGESLKCETEYRGAKNGGRHKVLRNEP